MSFVFEQVPANTTLYIPFASYGKTNGESITLTGLAVTDIEIYKNGSATQRASDNGYTLLDTDGIDFDSVTGIHGFSIDLSDNSDSGFFAAGAWYWVVVSAVTIDSQTVNFVAAVFRIVAAEGITGTPKADVSGWNGTAVASPHTAGYPVVTVKDGTGTGEIDTLSGKVLLQDGAVTAAVVATDAIDADAIAADAVTEIQSGLSTLTAAGIRTAVGLASANLDTQLSTIDDFLDLEVAAIKAKTDNLPSDPADASDMASLFTTVNTKLDTIDDLLDTEVLAIKAKTDLIPAAPAAVGDIPTATQNADALLKRDIDQVEATAPVHSLTTAILKLVSRFVASSGRTYRTDGATVHATQTPTTSSSADPVTELSVAS